MDLKQQLIDFGCSSEFVEIALMYSDFHLPEQEIETFIEYVEEVHAKVEAAEELKKMEKEIVDASSVFEEFNDNEEL
ncbi:MAG: hypothetical protein PHW64_06545 [Sulfuricurvum sp.]|nr:hypothetical protein [Sulfuricurvum sp.]